MFTSSMNKLRSQSRRANACSEPTIKLRKPGETEVAPLFNEQTNGPGETGGKPTLKRKRGEAYAVFGALSNDIFRGVAPGAGGRR
jgi:hypothetical protein